MAFQLTNLDFKGNQALNLVVHNLASAPATPKNGQVWFDTVAQRILFQTPGGAIDATNRASHSGTQTSATISDFNTAVRTNRLSEMSAPNAAVDFGGQRITQLGTPTAASDAVTKAYADAITSSLTNYRLDQLQAPNAAVNFNSQKITNLGAPAAATDAVRLQDLQDVQNGLRWKDPARVATTANITLSGLQTIDGISVVANNRVLVKNQTTASENGIWVAQSGAWTRATDAAAGKLTAGTALMVTEGSTQADSQWRLQTDDPITVGTTALTFTQIGAATSYSNGFGLLLAGNVFSVDKALLVTKASATVGDGVALQFSIAHNLNTKDITVAVYYVSTGEEVFCDITRTDVNTVVVAFATAPASGALRAVIHG